VKWQLVYVSELFYFQGSWRIASAAIQNPLFQKSKCFPRSGSTGCWPFKDVTTLYVNTVIATMESATESGSFFNGTSGAEFQGPNYGILDTEELTIGGLPYIRDYVTITVNLNENVPNWGEFFLDIDTNNVVGSFGSPTAPVPEPATMLLFGSGLVGLFAFRRKLKKK